MDQILRDAAPAVVQAASSSFGTNGGTALKCLEAWISWGIPAECDLKTIWLQLALIECFVVISRH
jgi:hypothetical protein